jgi:hypothetical protein
LFFAKGGYLTFAKEYEEYLMKAAGLSRGEAIPPPSLPSSFVAPLRSSGDPAITRAAFLDSADREIKTAAVDQRVVLALEIGGLTKDVMLSDLFVNFSVFYGYTNGCSPNVPNPEEYQVLPEAEPPGYGQSIVVQRATVQARATSVQVRIPLTVLPSVMTCPVQPPDRHMVSVVGVRMGSSSWGGRKTANLKKEIELQLTHVTSGRP